MPSHKMLPYVNKKVKEYNFRFAIHLHGPDMNLYPHASDIHSHIKDLDPRMGICLDIGHNMHARHGPITDLEKYKNRIFDIHMKNTTEACSLEYEKTMKESCSGIGQSIGYFRGVIDATK